jgi:hypothetical protein
MRKLTLHHIQAAAFIVFFCAVLILPGLLTGNSDTWNSGDEGRNAAEFPKLHVGEGSLNPELKDDFEAWFNDHLGLRSAYVRLKTNVYVGLLGKSTSEKVYLGKDGWYFYTPGDNIELATGEYPLEEAELKAIARNQQEVHNWYARQGIDYVLLLTPSKTTVYSEYLYGDYTVGQSPIDIVEQYLKTHTDVIVVNTKPEILAAKESGRQVYWKDDNHWNSNGSYAAYKALLGTMDREGILVDEYPVSSFAEDEIYAGDLKRMLGDQYLFGGKGEKVSGLSIEQRSTLVSHDDSFLKEASEVFETDNATKHITIYDNSAQTGTLLLYGDSFFLPHRKFPVFMAEHYRRLVYAGVTHGTLIPKVEPSLDELVSPEVVVFSCTERYLVPRLTTPQDIPLIVDDPTFLNLPIKSTIPDKDLYQGGLIFDRLNGEKLPADIPPLIAEEASYHTIRGWAVDVETGLPLRALYLKVGDIYLQCSYGRSRPDVAEHFSNEALKDVGYQVTIPFEFLKDGDIISFIAVSADGTHRLPERVFTTVQVAETQ